jgi:hypothetical protein
VDRYLKYGLPLFAIWIIASRTLSLIYTVFKQYPDLIMNFKYYVGISTIVGLLAIVAGIVIIVELGGRTWDIKRIAMAFLGLTLILVGVYGVLFSLVFNLIIPWVSPGTDSQTIVEWTLNVLRVFHCISALLIIVSLQEEGSVAKMGLFLYSLVTIAGIGFQFFGMEGNTTVGAALAPLGIAAAILILKRR